MPREPITKSESGTHKRWQALAALARDAAEKFRQAGFDVDSATAATLEAHFLAWAFDDPGPTERMVQVNQLHDLLGRLPR